MPRHRLPSQPVTMKIYHADHGVSEAVLKWALAQIKGDGFFLRTLKLPARYASLMSGLYGPAAGDAPVPDSAVHFTQRSADRPLSRMIAREKRPTRLLTLVGTRAGNDVTIFTAYGGPAAEREPGDTSLGTDAEREAASSFWSTHALASL